MLDLDTIFFRIPSNISMEELLGRVDALLHARVESPKTSVKSWFDTFDWRLFDSGLCLARDISGWQLVRLSDDLPLASSRPLHITPRFWWDFPKSNSIRPLLSKTLSVRALLEVLSVNYRTSHIKILNSDEKTVLRLQNLIVELRKEQREMQALAFLGLFPVRGYIDEYHEVLETLVSQGLEQQSCNIYEIVLEYAGRKASSYSSKLQMVLPAGISTVEAVCSICNELLSTMQANVFGIKEDVDTEFLHDFRVAMRRTRSVLAQVKHVFPSDRVDHFRLGFSSLSKKTNRLRDLDVYLINRSSYYAMLPDDLRKGLDLVFRSIESQRMIEHKKVLASLCDRNLNFLREWREFLDGYHSNSAETSNALLPAKTVSSKYIWKQYQKILRKGKKITDNSPDEHLHQIRIECKKLRYLLEFFASLFDETGMRAMIQPLKKLQDNLGNFNDFCVQQEDLRQLLYDFTADRGEERQVAAAVGGLIVHLDQKQLVVRMEFASTFSDFSSRENEKTFSQLFAMETQA